MLQEFLWIKCGTCSGRMYREYRLCPVCRWKEFVREAPEIAKSDPGFREFYRDAFSELEKVTPPPPELIKPVKLKKRHISSEHWIMLKKQGGRCALCGVKGWGKHKGKELDFGKIVRSVKGDRPIGILCQTCAYIILRKVRPKLIAISRRKRELCGDGPGVKGAGK